MLGAPHIFCKTAVDWVEPGCSIFLTQKQPTVIVTYVSANYNFYHQLKFQSKCTSVNIKVRNRLCIIDGPFNRDEKNG